MERFVLQKAPATAKSLVSSTVKALKLRSSKLDAGHAASPNDRRS